MRPGNPELRGPGAVQSLPPHFDAVAADGGDLEGIAVDELAPGGVDLGVKPGADQVSGAGLVPVRQRYVCLVAVELLDTIERSVKERASTTRRS
jgi:hypothetical protein